MINLFLKNTRKKSLSSSEKLKLDNDYGECYKWYDYKYDIEFIKYKLYIDDNIETIKKKIFCFYF